MTIQILSTPFATTSTDLPSLYAGQPISARLAIHTSFHWGQDSSDSERQYSLGFNIEEMSREWLISGPKRGDFVAVVRLEVISKSQVSLVLGWRNSYDADNANRSSPRRILSSKSFRVCSSDSSHRKDELINCREHRNLSGAWRRKGLDPPSRWSKHVCDRNGAC